MSDLEGFVPFPHFATQAVHVGQEPEQWGGRGIVPPISMATTFKQEEPGKYSVCICFYTRLTGVTQCPMVQCKNAAKVHHGQKLKISIRCGSIKVQYSYISAYRPIRVARIFSGGALPPPKKS